MKQKTHYSEALAYLRDYAGSCTYRMATSLRPRDLVRNYEGGESTVETVAAGDLVGCYPYCLDGDAAPATIRADKPCAVYVVDGQQLNQHLLQSKETAQVALQFLNYRFAQLHQHRRQCYFTHQPEDE